ncbi:MAG: TdeIII family type II restriction endonuclease [Candidatus Hodarchaeota archaeon]
MPLNQEAKAAIKEHFRTLVLTVLKRKTEEAPFIWEEYKKQNPFGSALIPSEIWKGSSFERSFVTSLGTFWETLALSVAQYSNLYEKIEHEARIERNIYKNQLEKITEILRRLEHAKQAKIREKPNWEKELAEVKENATGDLEQVTVIADIHLVKKENHKKVFMEVKSPKPNKDQSKVSKEKMLKLAVMEGHEDIEVYFALPYNPWESREAYNHPFPKTYFDMVSSSIVLIGKEFWDYIGEEGTYEELLAIANEVGEELKERIIDDYLTSESRGKQKKIDDF